MLMLGGEKMDTNNTSNIESELTILKNRVDTITMKIESLPSGKKAKMMGYIRDMHILAVEIEDRITNLRNEGYDNGEFWYSDLRINNDKFRSDFTESNGMYMDYDYSG